MPNDFLDKEVQQLMQSLPDVYKDVVVVGNGPSAITVSYFLSGQWPYYSGCPHLLEDLQCRLLQNEDRSLVEQDLSILCEGIEGRSSNPVSVLFDALNHPQADLGLNLPSALQWMQHPSKALDHVVVGSGLPGGSWRSMEGSVLTISLGCWMELPNLSYKEWEALRQRDRSGANCSKQNRASVRSVAQYYYDYVQLQGLANYFHNNARVTSISKVYQDAEHENGHFLWRVKGVQWGSGTACTFSYITPFVVLATGSYDRPNTLGVLGEELPFVIHSLSRLEKLIQNKKIGPQSDPIVIVGAGLSAADAIIATHFHNIPTIHVFRRSVADPDLIFNKLPENMYPEYHKVHQMMQGKGEGYYGYQAYSNHCVVSIGGNRKVHLQDSQSKEIVGIRASYVVLLVGAWPDLTFLPQDGKHLGLVQGEPVSGRDNPINIDLFTHECVSEPNMYALGPLVGDNFVRFVQGGALAITSHLNRKFASRTDNLRFDSETE